MIEIIGEPGRPATQEEINRYLGQDEQPEKPAWREAMMQVFLAGH